MVKTRLEKLLDALEVVANLKSDGHYTIFKFTTGWKIMLDTPNLDTGKQRDLVWNMKMHPTLEEAIEGLIASNFENV